MSTLQMVANKSRLRHLVGTLRGHSAIPTLRRNRSIHSHHYRAISSQAAKIFYHGWARMDTDGKTKTRLVVFFRRVAECILTDASHSLSQLIRAHPYHYATKSCIPDKIFWTVLAHRQGRGRRLPSVSICVHLWFLFS